MNLDALADFNAVASHGGFGRASRFTGRPKASLSRRVRELEDELGMRLIERGGRNLRLTEEGAALHEQTRLLLGRIDDIGETLKSARGEPHGRLRISAPVLFAQRGLGRLAARYAAMYPQVQLEITADDRFIDPLAEGYDIVIRANPEPTTELAGRCFLRDELVVVAAPSILIPAGDRENEPVRAVMLLAGAPADTWQLKNTHGALAIWVTPILHLSSMAMIHDAVLDGAGAAIMPRSLVQSDLDAEKLIYWGTVIDRGSEVWALYPPHKHVSRKVSAFLQMLAEQFVDCSPLGFLTLER